MPNVGNAGRPITLLGIGRSGTSLLETCFRFHPDVQSLGESSGFIFAAAAGAHSSLMPSAQKFSSREEYAGEVVRKLLVAMEPSEQPRWFHKPIGVPKLINWWQLPGEKAVNKFPLEWYWSVLESAFPQGMYLACLRNPFDVILSWERFRGWKQRDLWRDLLICYEIINYRRESFQKVVFFDDFIEFPEKTVRDVFDAVDLPMAKESLKAFDKPRSMGGNEIKVSHRDNWSHCEQPNVDAREAAFIMSVWKSFDRVFEVPTQFSSLFDFSSVYQATETS